MDTVTQEDLLNNAQIDETMAHMTYENPLTTMGNMPSSMMINSVPVQNTQPNETASKPSINSVPVHNTQANETASKPSINRV